MELLSAEDKWDEDLVELCLSQVTERATGILELDLSGQVREYKEKMEESVRRQTLELQEKEKESELRQSLETEFLVLVLEMQTREVVSQLEEEQKLRGDSMVKKNEVVKRELEEREKVLGLLNENVQERANELEQREEQFQLKAKDVEVKREEVEIKEKKIEVLMSELEAREKEQTEKSTELEKREEQFQLRQGSLAKEIEVKMRSLEVKEKELEEREELLKGKEKEFEERSKQTDDNRKRSRDECETSLFAENHRDNNHTGKRHKPIREHNTDLDGGLHGWTGSDLASASASEESEREVYEVECIDDESDEDPEPYNCLDADFNNFNNTMSSFSVGQVWALYDPFDHMPRFYAVIRRILQHQQRVQVTWLEPIQTAGSQQKKPAPIACGEFKHGDRTTRSHLMFSHEMDHVRTTGKKKSITVNPRKGETWALFRDWSRDNWVQQQKRPYSYDFVQVVSELDSVHGIGVAYLGRVEGFTSVYRFAEQNKVLRMMIGSDEMLRFSHRVPSFELKGDEKEGVPAGSFELDPAAIPRDYIEALNVKEEEGVGSGGARQ